MIFSTFVVKRKLYEKCSCLTALLEYLLADKNLRWKNNLRRIQSPRFIMRIAEV